MADGVTKARAQEPAGWEVMLWALDRDPAPDRLGPLADALDEAGHAVQAQGVRALMAAGLWPLRREDWRSKHRHRPRVYCERLAVTGWVWDWGRWMPGHPAQALGRLPHHLDERDFDGLGRHFKLRDLAAAATFISYARPSEAVLDLAEYLASPMATSKPQYAVGFIGRSACETDGSDNWGRDVRVPEGSLWRVADISEDPDPQDRRYSVVLMRHYARPGKGGGTVLRDDRRLISYDGAWDGFLEPSGLEPAVVAAALDRVAADAQRRLTGGGRGRRRDAAAAFDDL
jgi:hypothetical protein